MDLGIKVPETKDPQVRIALKIGGNKTKPLTETKVPQHITLKKVDKTTAMSTTSEVKD